MLPPLRGARIRPWTQQRMTSDIRIAAVIPTFNRGRLIGRCIHSVLTQSHPASEVIVVDDGSTDDTKDRVANLDARVRYIRQDNAGAARARNTGVMAARSEWVAFLDSDDYWTEEHLERIARAIGQTHGRAVFYFDDTSREDSDGHRKSLWNSVHFMPGGNIELVEDGAEWVMCDPQPMMLQASVFHRESFLANGGLWEQLRTAHDTHLFLKLGVGNRLCAVAGIGAVMTDDEDQQLRLTTRTGSVRIGRLRNRTLLYADILKRHPALLAQHRTALRRRAASAHWRLFRLAMQNGDFLSSLNSLSHLTKLRIEILIGAVFNRTLRMTSTNGNLHQPR